MFVYIIVKEVKQMITKITNYLDGEELIKLMSSNLFTLRSSTTLTQNELADIIGIPRTTYAAIENGKRKMTIGIFLNLASLFSKNSQTKTYMKTLGLDEETLDTVFRANELMKASCAQAREKVAAFGGEVTIKNPTDTDPKIKQSFERT